MKWHMGMAYGSYAPVILDPSLQGSGIADLVVMGSEQQRPDQIFEKFIGSSPAAAQFQQRPRYRSQRLYGQGLHVPDSSLAAAMFWLSVMRPHTWRLRCRAH